MTRCDRCKKNCVIIFKCKCEKMHCITHMSPELHECKCDNKELFKVASKIVKDKVIKI